MTTAIKEKHGKLGEWIGGVIVDWLYPIFEKKREAVKEAAVWDSTVCCIKCRNVIPAHAQFCRYCRTWLDEHEARRTASLGDTNSLHTIKINQTQYPIQYRGRRLFHVYMQDVYPLINDEDKWLRE